MTRLCELANKTGTDKRPERHNYTPTYSHFLTGRAIKRVLEIGIGHGESLRMWEEYFPEAEIWGADRYDCCLINEGRIHSVLCEQSSESGLRKIEGPFDFIVDDASHHPDHQIFSLQILMPLLSEGGLYIIEDVGYVHRLDTLRRVFEVVPDGCRVSQIETTSIHRDDSRLIIIEK
jgi:trans-aconitate methyltransferase